eukprot:6189753-Pleurochrysis_carterae.AAC.2
MCTLSPRTDFLEHRKRCCFAFNILRHAAQVQQLLVAHGPHVRDRMHVYEVRLSHGRSGADALCPALGLASQVTRGRLC